MGQLLYNTERTARGLAMEAKATGGRAPARPTLLDEAWRDFVYAEAWDCEALDLRSRLLISLAGCALAGADDGTVDDFVRGALVSGNLNVTELREAALHLGPYAGFTRARLLDRSVSRVVAQLGVPEADAAPIRAAPWDPEVRDKEGAAEFIDVMLSPSGPPVVPYLRAIHNFVFGEMWIRRGLDQRARRWLTLVGVCDSMADTPIRSHVHAAMASGNCTVGEMHEFVLHFAIHCGWPKASVVQAVVFEMHKRVEAGLPWNDQ